jgi:DNA mismatch endonuclease (patch repair protein)
MDNLTKRQRSETMSKIRSKETSPERKLRQSLFRLGYRYKKNVKHLPGCPDIVMKKYNSIIFINGCFWHHHDGCTKATIPHTNRTYWQEKLKRTTSRDVANLKILEDMRWKVMTIWECEINKDLDATLVKVFEFLKTSSD